MKKHILFCLLLFAVIVHSQDMAKYKRLTTEAFRLYEEKKFIESATRYNEAFASIGYKGYADDRYDAACAWAMAGMIDSSFTQLFKIAERAKYANLNHLTTETDLEGLHKDPRWPKLISVVAANKKKKIRTLTR